MQRSDLFLFNDIRVMPEILKKQMKFELLQEKLNSTEFKDEIFSIMQQIPDLSLLEVESISEDTIHILAFLEHM